MKLMQRNCRFLIIWFLLVLAFSCWTIPVHASGHHPARESSTTSRPADLHEDTVEISIRSSPDSAFHSTIRIHSGLWSKWIQGWKPASEIIGPQTSYEYIDITVPTSSGPKVCAWHNNKVSSGAETFQIPAPMEQALHRAAEVLHRAHFGKLSDWSEANRLLPRKSSFRIIDLETGLSFRGQRRAGSAHADVQPVTKEDSATMKRIYGGQWSWNRRAVLVETPEGYVAGSMHGMPHGGDGIPDNDFHGHFCIHYKGCVTHGSGSSDPAHQAMVHKAAGELEAYHKSLAPAQVAELFLVASSQKDALLASMLLRPDSSSRESLLQEAMEPDLKMARLLDIESDSPAEDAGSGNLTATTKTRVSIWRAGARPQTLWVSWTLSRSAPGEAWFIDNLEPEGAIR